MAIFNKKNKENIKMNSNNSSKSFQANHSPIKKKRKKKSKHNGNGSPPNTTPSS
jgi:hypothetical protein